MLIKLATNSHILATIPIEEKYIAICIRDYVLNILRNHMADRATNVFVTDNAENMKAAYR